MTETIVDLAGVTKSFGTKPVLRGIDLTLPRGSVVGLVGTNGCGKSTLIKCLLGLLEPSAGRLRVLGEDPWNLSAAAKERLGYVPQTVQLYGWMTVAQITRYVGAFYRNWDVDWVETLIDRWQLERAHRVATMSQGQQQKLALVLALGHRPELLILDEPVASLDPVARREFLRSLLELTRDNEHTVLFSTHITSDLERVASHVALLREGRIVMFDELDVMKDRVKRLRVSSSRPLPANFSIRGSLRTQVEGSEALVAVADLDDRLVDEVAQTWQAEVAVENLNLEEIFLELHHA